MAIVYMKRWSASPAIRNMRYHHTSVRMVIIKKTRDKWLVRM